MSTIHIPKDTEIETYSGRYFDFDNPRSEDICQYDIAHSLANICRFTGHVRIYYSVAEHAVNAQRYAEWRGWSKERQLACLHHDDAEAYLGDIVRPFKALLGGKLKKIEKKIDQAVIDALGLPFEPEEFHSDYVKEADNWCLMQEAKRLMVSKGEAWGNQKHNWSKELEEIEGPEILHFGYGPTEAHNLYRMACDKLVP
jgi:hypothetical protein